MNKQQLASKIWESANKMRSKIEANEYKDYILGFIFYKFLSEKEVKYLKANDWTDEYLSELSEEDAETAESVRKNLGYFISYDNLFSTWLEKGQDFGVQDVRDALSAFSRLINATHKKVFEGVFDTLQTGLSKLGDSAASQSKAISDLIHLIKDIPMDGKQDYDVLGFIYEYLIGNFAANAGKKAGEFYTPHEVSLLMSEIVANHLKDRKEIKIYDPTSGSGSLLINIGRSIAKFIENGNNIKYYAQELKQNTYNLTRMNLVMRGILPDNIVTRNGDTLEDDWPYFEENDPVGTYNPLYVDAVVSNPPYSQAWNPADKEADPRFAGFGLAPKGKADYAFLLHDLYHLKPDGIMTIVLPHGVLFRGGEEGEIRKNLIEKNHIDAIIGLPANIFFGTGIPTIIMVLRQKRENTDVLIIDASKGFAKAGKNNKLRACDIRKIADTVAKRETVERFSRAVSRDEIRRNDYNLNIPRYVDSSEEAETWDIYASMFGGIPAGEIDKLGKYWSAFPYLQNDLFEYTSAGYCRLKTDDVKAVIAGHGDVKAFEKRYSDAFDGFYAFLCDRLIEKAETLNISKTEAELSAEIFDRLSAVPLIDKYRAYQILDDKWNKIAVDLEILQTEGFEATKKVDPHMVVKTKGGREQEVQEGWTGHIFPFELVQKRILKDDLANLTGCETRLSEIESELEEAVDLLSEDDRQKLLNDDNTAFVFKEVNNAYNEILDELTVPQEEVLERYLALGKSGEKISFVEEHREIDWDEITPSRNRVYGNSAVKKYIRELKSKISFDNDSYEGIIKRVITLLNSEKEIKREIKERSAALEKKTKETIETLTDGQITELLKAKWIEPLIEDLISLPGEAVDELIKEVGAPAKKYETTFELVESKIRETESALSAMIDELDGGEFDTAGLAEFKKLIGGAQNG